MLMPSKAARSREREAADKDIHIAIRDHDEIRMSILESAKKSVEILQREGKLEELRKQKLEAFREMRDVLHEIRVLNLKLEKAMPKIKMSQAAVKREIEQDLEIVERPAKMMILAKTRVDELEQELADIEKRMSSLK
jgi:hypothetical protein